MRLTKISIYLVWERARSYPSRVFKAFSISGFFLDSRESLSIMVWNSGWRGWKLCLRFWEVILVGSISLGILHDSILVLTISLKVVANKRVR